MSKQSEEHYLDELLRSINSGGSVNQESNVKEDVPDNDLYDEAAKDSLVEEDPYRMTAKAEAEFLMEFEKELAGEDFDDFLADFDMAEIRPEDRLGEADIEGLEDIPSLEELALSAMTGVEEFAQEELPLEGLPLEELPFGELPLEELSMGEFPETDTPPALSTDDMIDLSQMGEEDLINLLANTEDLSDIGMLLNQSSENIPVGEEDPFAAFAEKEMISTEEPAKSSDEGKKKKSGGILEKMKKLFFGEENEESVPSEKVSLEESVYPDAESLSDENAEILAAFAAMDSAEIITDKSESDTKNKKKKNKKEKKAEPKAKKPAKVKAPKPKKEKKPKVVDNTPPLPKKPVALVFLFAISLFILIFMGTELISYHSAISESDDLYNSGRYKEAADRLLGIEIKKADTMFHGKVATLAAIDSELYTYEIFMKNNRKVDALDNLISAAGRCELNETNALTFDCYGEWQTLLNGIKADLEEDFGITYEQAIEIYRLTERDRDAYTIAFRELVEELGIQ